MTEKPEIGSRWVWEIDKPHARMLIEVTEVFHNGEEWWVRVRTMSEAPDPMFAEQKEPQEHLNELDRFWGAVTLVAPSPSGVDETGDGDGE